MNIFTIENQQFGWDEIVIAAEIWGEWQPFVEKVRQSLACLRRARTLDRLPSAGELQAAATAFRYAHNLISAEDTRAWLHRSGNQRLGKHRSCHCGVTRKACT